MALKIMWQETTRDQEEATHGTWGETTVPEAPALSTDFKVRLCSLCCLEWPNAHASFYSASWLSCYISLMHYSHNKNEFSSAVIFIFFLIFIFTLFYFTILYWFCHTLTWIHHGCTWVPKHEPPSHLPPHIISPDRPRAPVSLNPLPLCVHPPFSPHW